MSLPSSVYIYLLWKSCLASQGLSHCERINFDGRACISCVDHPQPPISFDHEAASSRLQSKVQQYVRGADQTVLEQMRLTVFEVVVGVLRSKEFMNDIPKAVETACKVRLSCLSDTRP